VASFTEYWQVKRMLSAKSRDKLAYDLAVEFLLNQKHVTQQVLQRYFEPKRPATLGDVYEGLLISAQNAERKANVIGGSIGGISNLGKVLSNFEPQKVNDKYGDDANRLFKDIRRTFQLSTHVNSGPKGLWPRYCKTILDSARFLKQFTSADDFDAWVKVFDRDPRTRLALPLLLDYEIYGIGLALACDFLKELGYLDFAKPDVHLRRIFTKLELCDERATDYDLLGAITRLAGNAGVKPYTADKVFWLIGSGKFYLDDFRAGQNSDRFISFARKHL
jgi:hypothetical protein